MEAARGQGKNVFSEGNKWAQGSLLTEPFRIQTETNFIQDFN